MRRVTFPSSFPQNGFLVMHHNKHQVAGQSVEMFDAFISRKKLTFENSSALLYMQHWKQLGFWLQTMHQVYESSALLSLNGFTATNCTFYNENKRLTNDQTSARETSVTSHGNISTQNIDDAVQDKKIQPLPPQSRIRIDNL